MKILGAPTHIWGEQFFMQMSQTVGVFVSIDESTKDKVRLDYRRALITTAVTYFINKVVEVKVNDLTYSIRLLEESFGDNYDRFLSDWKYQNSVGSSLEDDKSTTNSMLVVAETDLTAAVGAEDMQRLNLELSNPGFGKVKSLKDKGTIDREVFPEVGKAQGNDQEVFLKGRETSADHGEDNFVCNTLSVSHRAGLGTEKPN